MVTTNECIVNLNSNSNTCIVRPTEGQLKWALLNQKRIAIGKEHNFVSNTKRHGTGHDKNDTDDIILNKEGLRPQDELFGSEREYDQRRREILNNGYRFHRSTSYDDDEITDDGDENSCSDSCNNDDLLKVEPVVNEANDIENVPIIKSIDNNSNNHEHDTVRRPILPPPSTAGRRSRKFRKRRKKFQPRCSDPDRVRRFKEAFQAALHSLERAAAISSYSTGTTNYSTLATTKSTAIEVQSSPLTENEKLPQSQNKWIRTNTKIDDVTVTAVGGGDNNYAVYGSSTIPKRQPAVHNPTLTPSKVAPLDKSASWLYLLQSQTKTTKRPTSMTPGSTMKLTTNTNTYTPGNMTRYTDENNYNQYSSCNVDRYQDQSNHRSMILSPEVRQHVVEIAREILSTNSKQTHVQQQQWNYSPKKPVYGNGDTHDFTCSNDKCNTIIQDVDDAEVRQELDQEIDSFVHQFEEHLLLVAESESIIDESCDSSNSTIVVGDDDDDNNAVMVSSSMLTTSLPHIVETTLPQQPQTMMTDDNGQITVPIVVPVVTYDDSDIVSAKYSINNSHGTILGLASPISKNLNETFTIHIRSDQQWHSSWGVSDENNFDQSSSNNNQINTTATKHCTEGKVLAFSPTNLKHILRLLPDIDDGENNDSSNKDLEEELFTTKPDIDDGENNDYSKKDLEEKLFTTNIKKPESLQISDNRSDSSCISKFDRKREEPNIATKHISQSYPFDEGVCIRNLARDSQYSAGCGLYTNRTSIVQNYDVRWEKRLLL